MGFRPFANPTARMGPWDSRSLRPAEPYDVVPAVRNFLPVPATHANWNCVPSIAEADQNPLISAAKISPAAGESLPETARPYLLSNSPVAFPPRLADGKAYRTQTIGIASQQQTAQQELSIWVIENRFPSGSIPWVVYRRSSSA